MKRNSSIVRKLIIYFVLLNIFTVSVVSSYSYFRAKSALVERTFDQLTSLRIEKKSRVEGFFKDRMLDLELITSSENILNFPENPDHHIYSDYKQFFRNQFLSLDYCKQIIIQNQLGNVITIKPNSPDTLLYSHNPNNELFVTNLWKKQTRNPRLIIEDYFLDSTSHQPVLLMSAPIFNNLGKIAGIVVLEIDIEAINSIMFENNPHNGLGQSGESYLVGQDFLMRSTSRFQNHAILKTVVQTIAAEKALKGEIGVLAIKDYRKVSVLSSFGSVDIPNLNWAILAEIDSQEAMIPIVSIRNNILYLSLLITLLAFALVYLIAKRISLPIIKLKQAAENITDGNYDVYVKDLDSNDEISSLVEAFNEMSAKIKDQTENIKQERSMRLSSMIDGQELERHRLSRELHDGLGQTILALKMRLERTTHASPEKVKEIVKDVQGHFGTIMNEIRSISNDLMPAALNEFGLVDALSHLCREVKESSGIIVDLHHEGFSMPVEGKINTYLYRISQEALNNIVKHSGASFARIDLNSDSEKVYLTILDTGNGFSYSDNKKLCGNGISNMRERVHLLNGDIQITSDSKTGTKIYLEIPY